MIVGPASETTGQREMTSVIFLTCRNNSYIRGWKSISWLSVKQYSAQTIVLQW